jgi:hypothetical protein
VLQVFWIGLWIEVEWNNMSNGILFGVPILFFTNATQAGVSGLSDSVGGYKKSKMWISGVVTHPFWFTWFMEGFHKRVGEV